MNCKGPPTNFELSGRSRNEFSSRERRTKQGAGRTNPNHRESAPPKSFIENLLYPGDIILMESTEKGLFRKMKDWLLGSKWGHVAIYLVNTARGMPLVVESKGRGVQIRALHASDGRYMKILRVGVQRGLEASDRAYEIANNTESWYGYLDIPLFVLPRLFWLKLTGRNHGFGYRHNPYYICSELVDHAYARILFNGGFIPLPGDFDKLGLTTVWEGILQPIGLSRQAIRKLGLEYEGYVVEQVDIMFCFTKKGEQK